MSRMASIVAAGALASGLTVPMRGAARAEPRDPGNTLQRWVLG